MLFSAPIDVYLEEKETYQPDIIFVARSRLNIIEKDKINGAPDLVVEILSPSTAYYDLKKKFKIYAAHGVKEYWIVDPEEKSVEIYVNREGRFVLQQRVEVEGKVESTLLPGLAVEAREIFAPLGAQDA